MSKEGMEWCIALENIGPYMNIVLGPRFLFLKGERATKEKVFNYIPEMTEEDYNKYFRPATEEEINGEFEWDGEQFILKGSNRMKSIKEKAEEYAFIKQGIDPAGIQFREFNTNKQDGFEAGATYVLDILEQALTPQRCLTDMGMDICPEALVKTALQTIKELRK